jgi:hypothetical protein
MPVEEATNGPYRDTHSIAAPPAAGVLPRLSRVGRRPVPTLIGCPHADLDSSPPGPTTS